MAHLLFGSIHVWGAERHLLARLWMLRITAPPGTYPVVSVWVEVQARHLVVVVGLHGNGQARAKPLSNSKRRPKLRNQMVSAGNVTCLHSGA